MKGVLPTFDKLEIFPIGSIYTSINSTSPATLFGGTWTQIQGRFLLSASSSYAAGGTGGASTVNLSHVHDTSTAFANIFLSAQSYNILGEMVSSPAWTTTIRLTNNTGSVDSNATVTQAIKLQGNTDSNLSSSQSIMPPYLVVYMWQRTG